MKEYKMVNLPVKWNAITSKDQNKHLENFLNNYAREGWRVIHVTEAMNKYLLERDKNR
jgi:hypothetical protein